MNDKEIIKKLQLTALSEQAQQEMLVVVNKEIEMRLAGVIDDLLSEQQRQQLDAKMQETPEETFAWISSETGDLAELYEKALEDYIQEVKSKVNTITQ